MFWRLSRKYCLNMATSKGFFLKMWQLWRIFSQKNLCSLHTILQYLGGLHAKFLFYFLNAEILIFTFLLKNQFFCEGNWRSFWNILFLKMESSNLIDYSANMWWSRPCTTIKKIYYWGIKFYKKKTLLPNCGHLWKAKRKLFIKIIYLFTIFYFF